MKDMATAGMTHTKREPLLIEVAFPAQQRAEKRGSTRAAWEGWLNPCSPKHTDPLSCSLFPVYIRFKPKGKLTAACSAGWERDSLGGQRLESLEEPPKNKVAPIPEGSAFFLLGSTNP